MYRPLVHFPLVRILSKVSRTRTLNTLLLPFFVSLLVGCAAFEGYPKRATNPEEDLKELQHHINASAIAACLSTPSESCRNRMIAARMHAIDIRFSEFEEALFRDTREGGFGTTVATLGLTSAAAVSSGGASQVLAGIAALVVGGREAFQKEVLAERTVIAIHTAMRAKRAQVGLRLRAGLGQSLKQYPLALGLADLNDYYSAGTVLGALVGITETVGATAQQAEAELRTELHFRIDSTAQKFEEAVCGGVPNCPNPDTGMFDKIRNCWPQAGVSKDTLMLDFIMQERFSGQRSLVAECMGL